MFDKFVPNKYLSSKFVFGLDVVLSALSSFVSANLAWYLFKTDYINTRTTAVGMVASVLFSILFFWLFKSYRSIIRHSSIRSLARMSVAILCKVVAMLVVLWLTPILLHQPMLYVPIENKLIGGLLFDLMLTFCLIVLVRVSMVVVYNMFLESSAEKLNRQKILIYGTSDKSVSLLTRLQNSRSFSIIGFLEHGHSHTDLSIDDRRVLYFDTLHSVEMLKSRYDIEGVLFAIDRDARSEQERLIKYCTECKLKVLIAPSIDEVVGGKVMKNPVREIKIEDLLGRDEIKISIADVEQTFKDKVVMVTGAAGSIGSELCRQLAGFGVRKLVLFDNAETPMHYLRLELEDRFPNLDFVPIIGDVRLLSRLDYVFRDWKPQVVFHAAAYKHVPLMEENPCEAVFVNVIGTRNVADKCIEYGVERMVMVSTDKAVNPTNIMGCTKRLAEIYVQSLGLAVEHGTHAGHTKFVTTRFGNVLGSNGSVIPRFREQIAKGGPVTVTHPDITRFFMTIPEACRLVMEAATMSSGNQIFVFDMGESVKIVDLANRMIQLAGLVPGRDIEIAYTGLRPGEKLYEEVLSNTENTLPTNHHRIRIAKVREYDYDCALKVVTELDSLSRAVNIPEMVQLMKRTVPEFKSQNSRFSQYD